jgi:hypothetical protein
MQKFAVVFFVLCVTEEFSAFQSIRNMPIFKPQLVSSLKLLSKRGSRGTSENSIVVCCVDPSHSITFRQFCSLKNIGIVCTHHFAQYHVFIPRSFWQQPVLITGRIRMREVKILKAITSCQFQTLWLL